MRRQIVCAAAIGIAGAVLAATVTVNPPAGTETNVWAFVAGEDALAVNPGATGGAFLEGGNGGRVVLRKNCVRQGGIGLGCIVGVRGGGSLREAQSPVSGMLCGPADTEVWHTLLDISHRRP